jgi:Ca2+/Na+ antiporter
MIIWLSNLIGAIAAVWLISCGLVYMVSPKRGGEMIQRLMVFLAGALVGLCLLRQYAACIGLLSLLLLAVLVIVAAYLIREHRLPGRRRRQHRGASERMPVLPQTEEEL